jgi:hypothetical protein
LEPIIKKKSSFYLAPKLKDCILPRYWKSEGCMPAIAPIEDLRAAQEELLAARDLEELKRVFKRWRRIG